MDIASGATIQASSTITITADTSFATYQGQVVFGSDTLTLPATIAGPGGSMIPGPTWTSLGYLSGDTITVSSSTIAADDGTFTIASPGISTDGYTLTLTNSGLSGGTATATVAAGAGANDVGNVPINVTVDGTLSAASALIDVPPNSTRPDTFNVIPSATTPITVTGGEGTGTLNLNATGLAVTISGNTITVGNLKPVTFNDIEFVNINDAVGGASFTLTVPNGTQPANIPTIQITSGNVLNYTAGSGMPSPSRQHVHHQPGRRLHRRVRRRHPVR